MLDVAYSPDGARILTSSGDNTVRLWDAERGIEIAVLRPRDDSPAEAVFSPDGARILTNSATAVRLWDGRRGSEITVLNRGLLPTPRSAPIAGGSSRQAGQWLLRQDLALVGRSEWHRDRCPHRTRGESIRRRVQSRRHARPDKRGRRHRPPGGRYVGLTDSRSGSARACSEKLRGATLFTFEEARERSSQDWAA